MHPRQARAAAERANARAANESIVRQWAEENGFEVSSLLFEDNTNASAQKDGIWYSIHLSQGISEYESPDGWTRSQAFEHIVAREIELCPGCGVTPKARIPGRDFYGLYSWRYRDGKFVCPECLHKP